MSLLATSCTELRVAIHVSMAVCHHRRHRLDASSDDALEYIYVSIKRRTEEWKLTYKLAIESIHVGPINVKLPRQRRFQEQASVAEACSYKYVSNI